MRRFRAVSPFDSNVPASQCAEGFLKASYTSLLRCRVWNVPAEKAPRGSQKGVQPFVAASPQNIIHKPSPVQSLNVPAKKLPRGSQKGVQPFVAASPFDTKFAKLTNLPPANASSKMKFSQKLCHNHPAVPKLSSRYVFQERPVYR